MATPVIQTGGTSTDTNPLDEGTLNLKPAASTTPSPTPPTSPFSSSAMPVITQAAGAAASQAQTSLNPATPPVTAKTFQAGLQANGQPLTLDYDNLPPGFTTTAPTGTGQPGNPGFVPGPQYTTYTTPYGPVYQALGGGTGTSTTAQPGGGTTTSAALPQGITAGQPDTSGNVTYSGNGVTLKAPQGQANSSQLLGYANSIVQDNPGSSIVVNPDGTATLTLQGGITVPLSQNTLASPSAYGSAVGAATSAAQTTSANNVAAQAQIDSINVQLQESLQQISQESDAAQTAEGGNAGGGLGSGSDAVSAVSARYQQLSDDAKAQAQSEIAQINASLGQSNAQVSSGLASTLAQIEQQAQGTAIGIQEQAQSNFLSTAKTFDVSTSQFPAGTNLGSLQIGANGTTGVPSVDALIQQGVQAGYTPAQSLALVQAGVATQNKQNQSAALTSLANLSAVYGWAGMTPAQIAASPSAAAYEWATGLVQNAFPTLSGTAAQQVASAGTLASQKASLTATGSLSGTQSGLTGGQGGGPIGTITPGTTADPNYAIPGTEGLTQAAVDRAAQIMNATGKSATAALGSSFGGSAVAKTNALNALNNRAAQLNPNGLAVVQSEQLLAGAQTSIDTASTLKATVDASVANVNYSAGLLLGDGTTANPGLIANVNFGTDVVWNEAQGKYVSNVGAGTTSQKQADVAKYLQALNTITYEYGKIVYGQGAATVSSTEDAGNAMNGYLAAYPQTQVINQVLGEITARQAGIQSVIDGTANQIVDGTETDDNGNPILPTVIDPTQYADQSSGASTYNGITLPN